ncbi:MAG: hypothetical protein ACLFUJ_16415 [Phycisphaerae bacterium]
MGRCYIYGTCILLLSFATAAGQEPAAQAARRLWPLLGQIDPLGPRAAQELANLGDPPLATIREQIRRETEFDQDRAADRIRQLDDPKFQARDAATADLILMGQPAAPMVRKALQNNPSLEAAVRLKIVLEKLGKAKPSPEYLRRVDNLTAALKMIRSVEAMQTARLLAERTPFPEVQRDLQDGLVMSLGIALFRDRIEQAAELRDQRKLEQAAARIAQAQALKDLVPGLSVESAGQWDRQIQLLRKVQAELNRLSKQNDAGSRHRRALLELAEWQEADRARQILPAGQEGPLATVLAEGARDPDEVLSRAEAWEKLADVSDLSDYARTWLIGQAADSWRILAENPNAAEGLKDRAEAKLNELTRRLMANSEYADVVGLKNPLGSFKLAVLQANLVSARGTDRLPDKGEGWLYLKTWRVLGPIESTAADLPSGKQLASGPIPFQEPVKINQTSHAWTVAELGPTGMQASQPARNSTWFLYTEFIVDTAGVRDYAFGFDDTSALWVNGKEIYRSDDTNRAWNATEQVGKLTVRRGLNRVLIRLNNVGGGTGFSLLLSQPEGS